MSKGTGTAPIGCFPTAAQHSSAQSLVQWAASPGRLLSPASIRALWSVGARSTLEAGAWPQGNHFGTLDEPGTSSTFYSSKLHSHLWKEPRGAWLLPRQRKAGRTLDDRDMAGMQCFSGPSKICQRLQGIRRRGSHGNDFPISSLPCLSPKVFTSSLIHQTKS